MRLQKKFSFDPEQTSLETRIQGLTLFNDFIDGPLHDRLIQSIDLQPWRRSLKRRVQQYGYEYDYKSRVIDVTHRLGPLPGWANQIVFLLQRRGVLNTAPDQAIVNEYLPGQGIASHIDRESCFGEAIAILSLGSRIVMDFVHAISEERFECGLQPRSLLVLQGPARYEWKHGIAARKTDRFQGDVYRRGRRISLTLRKVLLSA